MSGASASRPADVLGIASLLVWVLVVVVCLKYVTFIMRVDHEGEGGILALLARAEPPTNDGAPVPFALITVVVIIGAAMLLGDGAITPAISVISAIEGLDVASKVVHPYLVPIAVAILLGLFAVQSRGTGKVGMFFGPAMILWFVAIAVAGIAGIVTHPAILAALNPWFAASFMVTHRAGGFFVLGGIVLAVTGVEALYADMSHFGRRPIVLAWYCLVFPALVLCYVGEAARILERPALLDNPFYALTPGWTLYPAIAIATIATVIASQALISGAFTLAEQAIALGLWPRMRVRHTSADVRGQVFVPAVNIALAIGCIALVLAFRSSDRLAAAFGLAVSCTMFATSIAYYVVIRRVLRWSPAVCATLVAAFAVVDGSFIIAGLPKFVDGGWVPFAVAAILSSLSLIWLHGRRRVVAAIAKQSTPLADAVPKLTATVGEDTPIMVFLSPNEGRIPFIENRGWVRDRAREERVVLLRLQRGATPRMAEADRVTIEKLSPTLTQIVATFGYMEAPDVAPVIWAACAHGIDLDRDDVAFFYADPKIEFTKRGLGSVASRIFAAMQRIARALPEEIGIPAERRIELSVSVDFDSPHEPVIPKGSNPKATAPTLID